MNDPIDELYAANRYHKELWLAGKCLACSGQGSLNVYVGCNCIRDKVYESVTCSVCNGSGKFTPLLSTEWDGIL